MLKGKEGGFALGCAAVGICALLLRLEFLNVYRQSPLFEHLFIDPATYDRWATLMAGGVDWTGSGVYPRPPLYIWFLALLYRTFGHSLVLTRLVQVVLGSLSCVLLAFLGRRFLSRTEALLGALLAALSWPLIFFDAQILYPSLIVFLELAFLLSLPPGGEGRASRYLLSGVLLGLLSLVNPLALLLLPAFSACVFLRRRTAGGGASSPVLPLIAGCLLALLPVTFHNRLAGGEWILVSANGGYNFFVGNNAAADGLSVWASGEAIRNGEVVPPSPGKASGHYYRRALRWLAEHPSRGAALFMRKAYYLVNAREIPSNFLLDRMAQLLPSAASRLSVLHFGVIGPLALAGCIFALKMPSARPTLIFLSVSAAGTVLFFVNARYRVPLLPLFYLMAVHGVSSLLRSARRARRGWRSLLPSLLLVFLLAVLVNSRRWGVDSRLQEAPLYSELGRALARGGDDEGAAAELRTTLDLDPSRTEDRYLLASLMVRLGENEGAGEQLRQVVAENPRHYRAWNVLGTLALIRQDRDSAAEFYRRALEIRPDYDLAARNLEELRRRGRREVPRDP